MSSPPPPLPRPVYTAKHTETRRPPRPEEAPPMRAGLATIQQTLAPEASAVLDHSVSDAARRGHGQTTPLHVAAALLSQPSGLLREACARSQPASSHPLQCRALDVCFSIALNRLAAAPSPSPCPPVNNALMAALKRAQANQRRVSPEQLQQPLLAVKVETRQLLLSILDDPYVSRVMKEASFSSVAVKAAIEQSGANPAPTPTATAPISSPRATHVNARLQVTGSSSEEEVRKVMDVLSRSKKRNPILVGESGVEEVATEVLRRIDKRERGVDLGIVKVVNLEEEGGKARELEALMKSNTGDGFVVNLGDLKWLLEAGDSAAAAVASIGRVIGRGGGVRLIGTANCATYLRLQVHHPTVEGDWDLQAVAISPSSQPPHPLSRGNGNGVIPSSIGLLSLSRTTTAGIVLAQGRKEAPDAPPPRNPLLPSSPRAKLDADLPSWLQAAVPTNTTVTATASAQVREERLNKWKIQPRPHLQIPSVAHNSARLGVDPPASTQVKTDLVLGQVKPAPDSTLELFGHKGEFGCADDAEDYKKLLKGLTEAVSWQQDAASAVALAVTQCRSGHGRRRPTGSKSDTWVFLMGPDKVGKRRMASALSHHLFSAPPTTIGFNLQASSRGKTAVDRLAEALWRTTFSVFLLEDVDEADAVTLGRIRRAIESGRLADSHGREVPLSAAVLVLTSSSLPEDLRSSAIVSALRQEARMEAAASGSEWSFELVTGNKRPSIGEGLRCRKQRRKGDGVNLCLDLNLAVGASEEEDDLTSSDLTWESGKEQGRLSVSMPVISPPAWLVNEVDLAVTFIGVDFRELRRKVGEGLAARFEEACGTGRSGRRLEVEEEVLDCVVGCAWFSGGAAVEERLDEAFSAASCIGGEGCVVRLVAVSGKTTEAVGGGWGPMGGRWLGVEM